jgi:putative acetyltransferase
MTTVRVEAESALQPEVAALLNQSDTVATRLYPDAYRRPITPDVLAKPGTHVLIARFHGAAVGLCVVFDRSDGAVEVKRMIVDEAKRGRGVGRALLRSAHATAKALGAHTVLLEVGVRNEAAQALYRSAGYKQREPFPPYETSPVSVFMELPL